jgi:protein TonB
MPFAAFSQTQNDTVENCNYCDSLYKITCPENIFSHPETLPYFQKGEKALMEFLSKNIRYPSTCAQIEGKVIIKFIVDTDGSIICIKIARSVDPTLDKEALRVINLMPKWIPASNGGKPVQYCYTLPIYFKISHKQNTFKF